ncbi:MAG: cob(I)yrinic acid a,c-diamide adenosyltransferase [Nocardioidaceae bacterium]|nr:cob(I)yrinic acid a,c-diamide adenosyltransferase [Nocardioidaceae bacterium]
MVNLTKIYTRTGDGGSTRLGDMTEVAKTDLRVAAYGDVNEANAHLGVAVVLGELDSDVLGVLGRMQNDLFDVGADLATPVVEHPEFPPLRVREEEVARLEAWCDHYNEAVEKLRSFVLPGGTKGSALLHVATTATRRAERSTWAAIAEHGTAINPVAARYLNRASDLLFILARYANRDHGDVLWKPGGERDAP